MSYCQHCGKKLEENERCSCAGAQKSVQPTAPKKINSGKKFLIPIVAMVALIVAGIFILRPGKPEINLEEYIVIEGVEGLNTQGELAYSMDVDALRSVMVIDNSEKMNDENYSELLSENFAQYEKLSDALSCIDLSASAKTGLSNGDIVTITATFENPDEIEFDFKFIEGSITYTVEGLVEGKTVDPFAEDAVNVAFEGFSGQAKAQFTIAATEEIYQQFSYSLSPQNALSNGDVVTLTVEFDSEKLEELGYFIPEQTEKTYTVSGLQAYLQISDGFPNDLLTTLCQDALQRTQTEHTYWIETIGAANVVEPELISTYFLEVADAAYPYMDYRNGIKFVNAVMVMTHHTTQGNGYSSDIQNDMWRTYIYPNFAVDSNGNITYETEVVGSFNFYYTGSEEASLEEQKFEYRDIIFTQIKSK